MRQRAALLFLAVVLVLLAGCGGESDPSPAATSPPSEPTPTTPALTAGRAGTSSTPAQPAASPVPARERSEIVSQAQDMAAAIARWDEQLAACIGPEGHADDSGATCTHAAWGRLVFQVDVAVWYLLGRSTRHAAPARAMKPSVRSSTRCEGSGRERRRSTSSGSTSSNVRPCSTTSTRRSRSSGLSPRGSVDAVTTACSG